eukprot:CAMPEP_0171519872 /NCGR_PEP_ID=MMETSP0959-20130129/6161_1 /TAXON_ID=87120 /ORGANISM="Aurantiochytrium limacinum, Strain ATCCMYA-1381" /LENGTH=380 /DNA_ID=CAMNT_0012059397 /DNA_START=343 /DNA_END=1483 /DNA_ORIENTATION=-
MKRAIVAAFSLLLCLALEIQTADAKGISTRAPQTRMVYLDNSDGDADGRRRMANDDIGLVMDLNASLPTRNTSDLADLARDIVSSRIIGGVTVNPSERSWFVALIMIFPVEETAMKRFFVAEIILAVLMATTLSSQPHTALQTLFTKRMRFFNLNDLNDLDSDTDLYMLSSYSSKIINSDYDSSSITNDIGIITFTDSSLKTTTPATLASENMTLETGESVIVTGYGNTVYNEPYDDYTPEADKDYQLHEVDLALISDSECESIYTEGGISVDMDVELCAMSTGKGSCSGDSGGPLIATRNSSEVVIGLVSWGVECADTEPTYPDVYTRVSVYESWIKTNVENICGTSSFVRFYNGTEYSSTTASSPSSPSSSSVDRPLW